MSPRNRFFILLGTVALISLAYYLFSTDRSSDLVLVGTVDCNQVMVSPQTQGRIKKLYVDEGTTVHAGDLIAVLDPSDLEAQQQAAAATIDSLRAKLAESESTERSVAGTTTGDVASARAQLEAARAQLLQAEATLENVESEARRTVELAQQGIASDQDRVQAQTARKAQRATVKGLKNQVEAAQANLDSALARTDQAAAARHTVASARSELANAEAQMKQADVHLGYTSIYSPVNGTVSVRAALEGEVVSPGSPIVVISDLQDTWVRAPIPETDADHIGLGETLRVRLPGGTMTRGKVIFKAVEADFATQRDVSRKKRDIRTLLLKVRLDNPKGTFVPGMTAEVLVSPEQLKGKAPSQGTSAEKQ